MVQLQRPRRHSQVFGLGGVVVGALLVFGCGPQGATGEASYEAQLAQHLAATGAVMYGAYWCPHCADQKAMFKHAAYQLPYIECAADGENAQPELCQQKGIKGYPTWEISGQLYPGVKPLDELADLSDFPPPP
ncbi:thioredoxin domain-containing protein [Nodosilinea nodulosa]|uniref:thioredoxin domain-containing protein n=1 Tax=Nodosilinea nodulosa TaxID=416001 RepID=UPI000475099C